MRLLVSLILETYSHGQGACKPADVAVWKSIVDSRRFAHRFTKPLLPTAAALRLFVFTRNTELARVLGLEASVVSRRWESARERVWESAEMRRLVRRIERSLER